MKTSSHYDKNTKKKNQQQLYDILTPLTSRLKTLLTRFTMKEMIGAWLHNYCVKNNSIGQSYGTKIETWWSTLYYFLALSQQNNHENDPLYFIHQHFADPLFKQRKEWTLKPIFKSHFSSNMNFCLFFFLSCFNSVFSNKECAVSTFKLRYEEEKQVYILIQLY